MTCGLSGFPLVPAGTFRPRPSTPGSNTAPASASAARRCRREAMWAGQHGILSADDCCGGHDVTEAQPGGGAIVRRMLVGAQLRRLRTRAGLTREQAAEAIRA